jgi:transcriptional regulator PpsR
MEAPASSSLSKDRGFLRGKLGTLEPAVAQSVVTAGGDVAMVIDRDGVICDIAVGSDAMARDGLDSWLDRRWSDTVTSESKHKVDELLRDALKAGRTRWREVNQITPSLNSLMMRFVAVDAGREGQVIAIGRDDRATTDMQQRLIEAQQSVERDYSRLRDAEFRYRLLFQTSQEAVLIVDATSRRIIEANPAAEAMTGEIRKPLVGELFPKMFEVSSQDAASALIAVAQSTARTNGTALRLAGQDRAFLASASLFRQDRSTQCLVRLAPTEQAQGAGANANQRLKAVLERMPDGFLITDENLRILSANTAFLDMVRVGHEDDARGEPLNRFLGREGLDRNILVDNLRAHGVVRNFSTVLRNQFNEAEDVEISAVVAPDAAETCFGFTIRRAARRVGNRAEGSSPELRRSVEQLTELVGRVKLKELVRETTDLVERLCIEAALELTKDNRASAADILGLSRQSLYSKLHRFGLVNSTFTDD